MRQTYSDKLEEGRVIVGEYGTEPGERFGAFNIMGPCGERLVIIASDGMHDIPWEHVSVSLKRRMPNWTEMCFAKALFWDDEEAVMQLHPPRSQWINNHPYCLHLWRPIGVMIPLPPSHTVGMPEFNL